MLQSDQTRRRDMLGVISITPPSPLPQFSHRSIMKKKKEEEEEEEEDRLDLYNRLLAVIIILLLLNAG